VNVFWVITGILPLPLRVPSGHVPSPSWLRNAGNASAKLSVVKNPVIFDSDPDPDPNPDFIIRVNSRDS
jgi:hypothetical protein